MVSMDDREQRFSRNNPTACVAYRCRLLKIDTCNETKNRDAIKSTATPSDDHGRNTTRRTRVWCSDPGNDTPVSAVPGRCCRLGR
ncbi:hypothetical protein LSAT2_001789 [Lamellibrachia satsuma]|nr:hypothetical protein LSAT2_001789 [Lamellibrachia satsuma]